MIYISVCGAESTARSDCLSSEGVISGIILKVPVGINYVLFGLASVTFHYALLFMLYITLCFTSAFSDR